MFARLHRALGWGCKILDVDEPELYVQLDPVPNAFTYGHTRPFIVLTSGLVDMLDDEERFYVIAHELGHIKAGHVLYTVLAQNIADLVSTGRAGDARHRVAAGAGAGPGAARLVPQVRADRGPRRPPLRAGHRPLHPRVHEAGRGREPPLRRDGSGEFVRQIRDYEIADQLQPQPRLQGCSSPLSARIPSPSCAPSELDGWHGTGYRELAGPRGLLGPATTT